MAITFQTVRWKNLLSTGNAFIEMPLNTGEKTILVGSNGSGKSTVLEALSFALYGKPFRSITKLQLVNSVNEKNCLVELELDIGSNSYFIRRGQKPSVFEIYKNGDFVEKPGKVADYQEYLENVLGMGYKAFTQTVILGSSDFVPFMKLPAANRREFIENLLDINIFSTMNKILKDEIKENKENLDHVEKNIDLYEEKIDLQEQYIQKAQKDNTQKIQSNNKEIKEYRNQISDNNNRIDELNQDIEAYNNSISDKRNIEKKIKKYEQLETQIVQRLDKMVERIHFFSDHADCPTCKQDMSDEMRDQKINELTSKHKEVEDGLNKLRKEKSELNVRLDDIRSVEKSINETKDEIQRISNKNVSLENYIRKLQKENENLENSSGDVDENRKKIEQYRKSKTEDEKEKERLLEQKKILDISSKMLKDSGVKTKIIKQYVPVINKLINKYLYDLDFFVSFELDENFNETIKSRYRDTFTYGSFSEGQKMRIDLALLMTWRDIARMKNSVNTNLLILDEVFDASLDDEGCENFMKMLDSLETNISPFVISHKGDSMQERFDKIISFRLNKNFTEMDG